MQKVADQVRVNVQLINAQSDSHLWAESYDRKLTDVFSVESEIAKRIAESLQAKLSPAQANALAAIPTRDAEAYDLFLQGEYEEREAESTYKGRNIRQRRELLSAIAGAGSEFRACLCAVGLQPLISPLVRWSLDVGTIGGGKV